MFSVYTTQASIISCSDDLRAVPEIILGGGWPHYFSDPSTPRTNMESEPPTPRTHKCFN